MSDRTAENREGLELKVGIFVLTGLAAIAVMVVYFGALGDTFRKSYLLTVELPDASGLLKDSEVLLAGARIGKVSESPKILLKPKVLEAGSGVEVALRIREDIRIPAGSSFLVGSSGLLGDRFVAVRPPPEFDGAAFIEPGTRLAGTTEKSLQDLQREGGELILELREAVSKINSAVGRVESEFLGNETIGDLKQVFANIKNTSESFAEVSAKITHLIDGAGEAIDKASSAIETVSGTLAKGGETLENASKASEELRVGIADARRLVGSVQKAVDRGTEGDGLISSLLNDRKLASDLSALVRNLKEHGLLFYRDAPEESRTAPREGPPPTRGRPTGR